MKERRLLGLTVCVFVPLATIGLLCAALTGWRASVNSEFVSVFNAKPYYRSWTMSYSDGSMWLPNGKIKHLWHAPRFHHLDMRSVKTHWQKYEGFNFVEIPEYERGPDGHAPYGFRTNSFNGDTYFFIHNINPFQSPSSMALERLYTNDGPGRKLVATNEAGQRIYSEPNSSTNQ